jgi:hypothetical protein
MGHGMGSLLCGKLPTLSCDSCQSLKPSATAFLSAAITLWL